MSTSPIDFSQDKDSATQEDLRKISEKADELAALKARVEAGNALLKDLNKQVLAIETEDLPEMMRACGLTSFTTGKGIAVAVKPFIQASLPAPGTIKRASGDARDLLESRLREGLDFITANGGESIIKSEAFIDIGKDPEKREQISDLLMDAGLDFDMSDTVHAMTLKSWVSEKMASGVNIPDAFNLFTGEKATVKLPKGK